MAAVMLAAPAAAQADSMQTVMPAKALTSIAATNPVTCYQCRVSEDGLTIAQLVATNATSPFASATSVCDGDADADDVGCLTVSAGSMSAGDFYLVRPGDTLSGIAARTGTTVAQLAALNGLNPENYLLYGTVLRLPGGGTPPANSLAGSEPIDAAAAGSLRGPP